jgi:hypothetical protein
MTPTAQMPVLPGAVVGLDLTGSGQASVLLAGTDWDQDGIPDVIKTGLQQGLFSFVPHQGAAAATTGPF